MRTCSFHYYGTTVALSPGRDIREYSKTIEDALAELADGESRTVVFPLADDAAAPMRNFSFRVFRGMAFAFTWEVEDFEFPAE